MTRDRNLANNNRSSSNNNVNNVGSGSDQAAKKSVSLQVPEKNLLVGIDHSSTSSHATAFTAVTTGMSVSGGAAISPSSSIGVQNGAGKESPATAASLPPITTASTSGSASALSLAARRLSSNKFFPKSSKRPIELEDDDVPLKLPPLLSAHNFRNE